MAGGINCWGTCMVGTCGAEGACMAGGVHGWALPPPPNGWHVGGTHPTGMLSCKGEFRDNWGGRLKTFGLSPTVILTAIFIICQT